MTYEELLLEAPDVDVIQHNFQSDRIKGLYCDGVVALNENIETSVGKACVLAEELGHHYTSTGNIIDQSNVANRKQELHARIWAYNEMIGLRGIISAHQAGCRNPYEVANHLGVTEEFLLDAIQCYHSKYGQFTTLDNYVIFFEPSVGVFELI